MDITRHPDPLRIAVAGAGYWGKNLVRNFAQLRVLHTLCDANEATLKAQAALYPGVRTSTDYEAVLADEAIHGVVLATPAIRHHEHARAALLAGKHVFVEKPLALSPRQGEELVALAQERGLVLMVGHILEYHPAVTLLHNLVLAGELGQVRYLYSNRLNLGKVRMEENILWSFAPHDIAVITRLVGAAPLSVSASGGTYLQTDIADVTVTNLVFPGDVRAHIFVSWLHPYKEQKLVVVGDRKMAVFDDTVREGKLKLYDKGIEWQAGLPVPRQTAETTLYLPESEPMRLECEDFLDCIRQGRQPLTDGASGLRVLHVLDACQRSLAQGGVPITLAEVADDVLRSPVVGRASFPYFAHPTAIIDPGAEIGGGTKVWHFSHVMPGARLGRGCNLGQNVFVAAGVTIGDNVKIQNNVSLYTGVEVADDVFLGPSMVFTNVVNPRSHVSRKDEYQRTLVGRGVTIGANATIVCGVSLGEYAFVGAGAVVTRDVPPYALVHGNPARVRGWVCQCGVKLSFAGSGAEAAACSVCGRSYARQGDIVRLEQVAGFALRAQPEG